MREGSNGWLVGGVVGYEFVSLEELLAYFARSASFTEPGGIIVLAWSTRQSTGLTHICHKLESVFVW